MARAAVKAAPEAAELMAKKLNKDKSWQRGSGKGIYRPCEKVSPLNKEGTMQSKKTFAIVN